mmetsp:Transcript_11809/g.24340  ORF Transcript_11809/g.24340 Transcript_11809/m.24340 type:complete len:1213 (-) Transcript_11809:4971-8609(-)
MTMDRCCNNARSKRGGGGPLLLPLLPLVVIGMLILTTTASSSAETVSKPRRRAITGTATSSRYDANDNGGVVGKEGHVQVSAAAAAASASSSFVRPLVNNANNGKKKWRKLQQYGRQGYKITNDSTETPPPTVEPTKKPTRKPTPEPTRGPTNKPTNKPTRKPTRKPTNAPPTAPPGTAFRYDDGDEPTELDRCHGDCDDDDDCKSGLICLQRTNQSSEVVYGCGGTARGGTDYCVNPDDVPKPTSTPVPTAKPTRAPTPRPTKGPTKAPTKRPTREPTKAPTLAPSRNPTMNPTASPVEVTVPVVVPPEEISREDDNGEEDGGGGDNDGDDGDDEAVVDSNGSVVDGDGDASVVDGDGDGDGSRDVDDVAAGTEEGEEAAAAMRAVDVEVPVPEFSLGLEYPADVATNNVFRTIIEADLEKVLTGYLNQELDAAINTDGRDDGVVFEGVDLTVAPSDQQRGRLRRRQLRVETAQKAHHYRAMQEDETQSSATPSVSLVKFDVGGTVKMSAQSDAQEGEEDDELKEKIQEEVDAAIRTAVADEDRMMAYIKENASTNLLKASEGVEEPAFTDDADRDIDGGNVGAFTDAPPDGNDSNGSSVGRIIGFALIGVMAAGLLATGFVLYKRRQYRQRQNATEASDSNDGKTRGAVPVSATDIDSDDANAHANAKGSSSPLRLIPFGSKTRGGGAATHDDLSSSSDDYGLDEGTRDDDEDTFARELQAAATVDKKAWDDLHGLRDRTTAMNKSVEPIPPSSRDVPVVHHDGDNLGPIHEDDDAELATAAAAAAGLAGAAGVAAVASSRQSGRKSPMESLRGLFGSKKQDVSDTRNVQLGSDAGGPPSGPPSESSGGWPAGDAATVASILAGTQMQDSHGETPASSLGNGSDMAVGPTRGSALAVDDGSALQEFQSVKRFVNTYENSKVRVDGVDGVYGSAPADDANMLPSESTEDREFLAKGVQSFYSGEQSQANMYGVGAAAGAAGAAGGALAAQRGAGSDPPGANAHYSNPYEDDATIESSVMNSVADESYGPDGRRLGITPYGEQTKQDRAKNGSTMVPIEQQGTYDDAESLGDDNRMSNSIPVHEQDQQKQQGKGDRLGINPFSLLKRKERDSNIIPVEQVNVSSPSRQTKSSFFPKSKPVTVVESPKAHQLNTTVDTAPESPSPVKAPRDMDTSGDASLTDVKKRAREMIEKFEGNGSGVVYPPNESWQYTS